MSFFSCSLWTMALMETLAYLRSRVSSTFVMENISGMRGSLTWLRRTLSSPPPELLGLPIHSVKSWHIFLLLWAKSQTAAGDRGRLPPRDGCFFYSTSSMTKHSMTSCSFMSL